MISLCNQRPALRFSDEPFPGSGDAVGRGHEGRREARDTHSKGERWLENDRIIGGAVRWAIIVLDYVFQVNNRNAISV